MSGLESGGIVGRYRILRFLGAGAMGEVYLAEDPQIERQLAIKTVRLVGRDQEVEDRKKRLLREARAAGRLLHPNVVTLFDTGEAEGLLFLAFEYVEGSDLASRLEAGPALQLWEVLRVARQAAEALDYAHRQGIVHRDIKPSNILIDTQGRVKVADFGIAKMAGQSTELTLAGSVMGSPQYLSPEQIRGEDLDGRSDIFSLGVVLYELLSGRRPFDGDTLTTLVYKILHQEPPPVSGLRTVPPRLEQLLARMLAKDKAERLETAGQVADELAAIERELPDETLSAPITGDFRDLSPTRVLPQRTTAVTPAVPPLPTLSAAPGSGPTAVSPVAPTVATGTAPPAAARSRAPLFAALAAGLVVLFALAVGGGWFLLTRRAASSGEPSAAVAPSGVEAGATGAPAASAGTPGGMPAASQPEPAAKTPVMPTVPMIPTAPTASDTRSETRQEPRTDPAAKTPARAPAVQETCSATAPGAGQVRPPLPSAPGGQRQPPQPAAPASPETVPRPAPREPDPEPAAPEVAADQRMRTGMNVAFRVTPADAFVLVDGTVIGRAQEYSGLKGSGAYTLSDAGEHLIKIRKQGMKDHVIAVDAAGGATTPISVRLKPLGGDEVEMSDLEVHRVREAVSFKLTPADATVRVDGRPLGPVKGGLFGRGAWVPLAPGTHRVSIDAPGFQRRDLVVEVTAGAEEERKRIDVSLVKGEGP